MPKREPDPRFESEYHPRLTDHARSERTEWNSFDGDGASDRRSQQADLDERSSWYERNNRRHQAHLQHQVDRGRSAEHYREDFGHPGYGERYGFSGYGRSRYDPDINRGYMESPEVETWREGARFTDREQDYRGGRWNRETHGYHDGDGRMAVHAGTEYIPRHNSPRPHESLRGPSYSSRSPESREYADYPGGPTEQDFPNGMNNGDGGYVPRYDNRFGRSGYAGIAPKNYQRSDARMEEDICEQLTANPYIDPSNIEIKVVQGEVTLTGDVADRRMKRLAEDIAEETPGVRNVTNRIHIGARMTDHAG